jgi:hypothetical protein
MGHRKRFPLCSRPLILRNGAHLSFISRDRESDFTGGPVFGFQQKVHADDRNDNLSFRFIGDDGRCNDCGDWCATLRLDGLDNTNCRFARPSEPSFGLKGRLTAATKKRRAQRRVPKPGLNFAEIYHKELLDSIANKSDLVQPFAQVVMLVLLLRAESIVFPSMLEAADDLQRRRTEVLRRAESILALELPLTREKLEPILALVLHKFESEFQKGVPTTRPHPAVARLKELIDEARGRIQRLGQITL